MPKKRNHEETRGTSGRKVRGAGSYTRAKKTRILPRSESWAWLDALSGPLDPDMVEAALEQPTQQDRPDLDKLFPT
ncbi:MAG: hypothetical protein R3D05_16410 [Dongiaceae bacterium]